MSKNQTIIIKKINKGKHAHHGGAWKVAYADFVTAIVVHRVGKGGRYFWRRFKLDKFHTLRDRILREVLTSLDLGKILVESLREFEDLNFDLEIHIDVGVNGKTKQMIQEVVGIVRANNFEAKTKPESYAASSVADRHI